jgi:hypothetical protein
VPTGALDDDHHMSTLSHALADLGQMQVHRLDVDSGHHESGAGAARRTDRPEQVGPA